MKKYRIKKRNDSLFFVSEDESESYQFIGNSKYVDFKKKYKSDWIYFQKDQAWFKSSYINRIKNRFDES